MCFCVVVKRTVLFRRDGKSFNNNNNNKNQQQSNGKEILIIHEIAPLNRSKLTTLFRPNVTKNTRPNIFFSCYHCCCCCFRFCAHSFLILVNFHTKVNDFIPVKLHNEIIGPIPFFKHSKICCFPPTNNIFLF